MPSSMHTPWAGSNRYKISELMSFTAERPLPVDSPSLPFCVRFNEPLRRRRQHYGFTSPYRHAATLDNGPLAKSYPCGSHTRLSSNHFQSARALHCYAVLADIADDTVTPKYTMWPQSTSFFLATTTVTSEFCSSDSHCDSEMWSARSGHLLSSTVEGAGITPSRRPSDSLQRQPQVSFLVIKTLHVVPMITSR